MARWRAGYIGTLRLGLAHALYCIGCCWALMVVLVAAGAMGLHWVLLIAALVAAEKLAPGGAVIARTAGGCAGGPGGAGRSQSRTVRCCSEA